MHYMVFTLFVVLALPAHACPDTHFQCGAPGICCPRQ